jgi:hypothetical protein
MPAAAAAPAFRPPPNPPSNPPAAAAAATAAEARRRRGTLLAMGSTPGTTTPDPTATARRGTASVAGNGILRPPSSASSPAQGSSKAHGPIQPPPAFLAPQLAANKPKTLTSLTTLSAGDKLKLLTLINSLALSQDRSDALEGQVAALQHQLRTTTTSLTQSLRGEEEAKIKCEELATDIHRTMDLVLQYEAQVATIQGDLDALRIKSAGGWGLALLCAWAAALFARCAFARLRREGTHPLNLLG